jgi:predicted pyridoxine 5'-phosphate oxidase superfamily flavin-nucleotide-binding protein
MSASVHFFISHGMTDDAQKQRRNFDPDKKYLLSGTVEMDEAYFRIHEKGGKRGGNPGFGRAFAGRPLASQICQA